MFSQVARRLAPAGVLVSVALAGCNTVGSTGGVAVVEEQTKEASGANISSLSEVIQRNPNDPAAYNTRGAAYARLARYSDAINDFNKAVQVDPNYAPAYANRALAFRQTNRNDAAFQPRHRRRPVLCAGLSRPRQPPAGAG
jgi:Flp pilus assembly protein TadD